MPFRGNANWISSVAGRAVSQALPRRARCSQIQCRLGGVGHGMPARCKPTAYIGLELRQCKSVWKFSLSSLSFLPSFTSSSSAPSSTGRRVRIDVFCSVLFCCSCDVLGPCTGRPDHALTLHLIVRRQCTLARLGLYTVNTLSAIFPFRASAATPLSSSSSSVNNTALIQPFVVDWAQSTN